MLISNLEALKALLIIMTESRVPVREHPHSFYIYFWIFLMLHGSNPIIKISSQNISQNKDERKIICNIVI